MSLCTDVQLQPKYSPESAGLRFFLDPFLSLPVRGCAKGDGVCAGATSAAASVAFKRLAAWTAVSVPKSARAAVSSSSPSSSSIAVVATS